MNAKAAVSPAELGGQPWVEIVLPGGAQARARLRAVESYAEEGGILVVRLQNGPPLRLPGVSKDEFDRALGQAAAMAQEACAKADAERAARLAKTAEGGNA